MNQTETTPNRQTLMLRLHRAQLDLTALYESVGRLDMAALSALESTRTISEYNARAHDLFAARHRCRDQEDHVAALTIAASEAGP